MKYYISYFYKLRFFPPNLVPVSTAQWDPKWYHAGKDNNYLFKDKRGVVNGVRLPMLNPSKIYHGQCTCTEGSYKYNGSGEFCGFMKDYYEYLNTLDFDEVIAQLDKVNKLVPNANVCLMVHEPTSKPCGERAPLIQWFKEHGIELIEWENGL
jgi:hypothetical protein